MITDNKPLPDRSTLLAMFLYDPETGILRWRVTSSNGKQKAGTIAGSRRNSYWYVGCCGFQYAASRVIWKMEFDEEPPQVDHRDLDGLNNRLNNLRSATYAQNKANHPAASNSKTGVRGVKIVNWKYQAGITVDGCAIYLGRYDTLADATIARRDAEQRLLGEFACQV